MESWFWKHILAPFLSIRLVWILTAWFAGYFFPHPSYSELTNRGWFLSPYFLIDIWSRWDSKWYLSIVKTGYTFPQDYTSAYSTLPFFPLYPYLVRLIALPIPESWKNQSIYLLIGIILSNLFFIGAAVLLYKLVKEFLFDEDTAQRTLTLLYVYPASFFFACFYTESLFLFLVVGCFYYAMKSRWLWVGLLGGLLSLSRPQGFTVVLPLLVIYLEQRRWNLKSIRADILWLVLLPIAFAAHIYYIYTLTGSFFAVLTAQKPWGRGTYFSLDFLLSQLNSAYAYVIRVDSVIFLIFLALGIWMLWKLPSRSYGIFTLVMLFFPLTTSTLISMARYVVVVFPVFIMLGLLTRRQEVFNLIKLTSFALQILYWIGWQNYYWIS